MQNGGVMRCLQGDLAPRIQKSSMFNSAEPVILNAHKYKKISRDSAFSGSDKLRMLFLLLINVKLLAF